MVNYLCLFVVFLFNFNVYRIFVLYYAVLYAFNSFVGQ